LNLSAGFPGSITLAAAGRRILTAQGRALHGIVKKKEGEPPECLSHGKGKQPDGEGKK